MTGMFEASFSWTSLAEEAKRRFRKTLASASQEEESLSAGFRRRLLLLALMRWLEAYGFASEESLQLPEEYGMRHWIVALLDPAPIEKGSKDRRNTIQMPLKFDVDNVTTTILLPASSALRLTHEVVLFYFP